MAQFTKIFVYNQRHRVVLLDTTADYFTRRYQQVYTRNLKVSRGTSNQILFEFVNQDQKPVSLLGMTLTFRMISREGEILLEKDLELLTYEAEDPDSDSSTITTSRGQAKLVLTESDLDDVPPQEAHYSIERVETDLYEPVYVDDNASARGVIEVLDQVMPSFIPTQELSIPEGQPTDDYVSSMINTAHQSCYTMFITFENFSGTFSIEGTTVENPTEGEWYNAITPEDLEEVDGLAYYNVTGYHPFLRLHFSSVTAGSVVKIQYR